MLRLTAPARLALLGMAATGLVALTTIVSGGRPVLFGVLGLLMVAWVLQAPLVGLALIIVTQVIWLIGNYAPGGMSLLSPSKLATLLTLGSWIVWALRQQVAMTWAPHMMPLGLFFLLVLLGPVLTPAFDDSLVGIGKYAMMVLPYLLVANLPISRRGVLVAAAAISGTATLSALLGVAEFLLPGIELKFGGVSFGAHVDELSVDGATLKRVTGGIGDANWFSYTMATALPLCLFWFRYLQSFWGRATAVGMAVLQMGGLVLSFTRTPLVGLAAAVVFLVWKRRIAVMPLLLAALVGLVTSPAWVPEGLVDRFFSQKYLKEGSTPMRREIYQMAIELIQDRPVLGHGYQQYGPQFIKHSRTEMGLEWARRDETEEEPAHLLRAHNLYLDVWVQHGVIGLALLLSFYIGLLKELGQVANHGRLWERELAIYLMACLWSFYLCGIGGHSQELKIFWVIAGLAAALRRVACSPSPDNSLKA